MDRRFYPTGKFAQKADVSIRTLRYYDREGLLSPSGYTPAGYRLYTDADLGSLQQILALKFLGFSLDEIKVLMRTGPQNLQDVLAQQKSMMQAKRVQLDGIIQAIEQTEQLLQTDACDWDALISVIQVIQMEQRKEWVSKYLTPEQQEQMVQLSQESYNAAAQAKLAGRAAAWTEADQERASAQWAEIGTTLTRLVAAGADPAGAEAQALVARYNGLIAAFTGGDPDISSGLSKWWQNHQALPPTQRPVQMPYGPAEQEFFQKALAASRA